MGVKGLSKGKTVSGSTHRVTGDHLKEDCLGKTTPEKDLIPSY